MIEVMLCSVVTILPDFLYRRFVQGKRLGRELTLYSIWYELRYGITACLGLTILLLTLILYFHPSTSSAVSFYRTVPVLPEGSGRVEEVYVELPAHGEGRRSDLQARQFRAGGGAADRPASRGRDGRGV